MKSPTFPFSRFWLFFWVALLAVFMIGSGFYRQEESVPEPVQTVHRYLGDLPEHEKEGWRKLTTADALYLLENCLDLTE